MSATPTFSGTAIPLASLTPAELNELSPYNYVPTEYVAIIYVVLFSIVGSESPFVFVCECALITS